MEAKIRFVKNIDKKTVPTVTMLKSLKNSGTANFLLIEPNILSDSTVEYGESNHMELIDNEGVIKVKNITVKFVNGEPAAILAIYNIKKLNEWDRLNKFLTR